MNRKGAVPVPVLIAAVIIFIGLAAGSFLLYQKEHSENIQLKDQIDDLNTRQRVTETKYEESKKIASELELKVQEAKTQIDALTSDLQKEKTARVDVETKLDQFRVDLEQQKALRTDLENKLGQAQDDGTKARALVKELESQKLGLELKVKELEAAKNVELGKVVVHSDEDNTSANQSKATKKKKLNPSGQAVQEKNEPAKDSNALEGKILVVNKEFNFVVINLGSKDRIETGNEFSVYHGNKMIGDIKVEKVHDSMSAAGFSDELKDRLSESDRVVLKTK